MSRRHAIIRGSTDWIEASRSALKAVGPWALAVAANISAAANTSFAARFMSSPHSGGEQIVPVFTSEPAMAELLPDVSRYRLVPLGALASQWPADADLSLTIDAGSPHGLTLDAHDQRYEMLLGLLLDTMARLIRVSASGRGEPPELALAERLIPPARQPAWAELWQAILRDKADARELNLDRKALLVRTFARIEAASRT